LKTIPLSTLQRWENNAAVLQAHAENLRREISQHLQRCDDSGGLLLKVAIGDACIGATETAREIRNVIRNRAELIQVKTELAKERVA
jgi:hypothetical protein